MEPRNFASPDATERSREARLNKLRERRTKAVTINNEAVPRPFSYDSKPHLSRSPDANKSPEPIIDPRFDNRNEGRIDNRLPRRVSENKVKPLPNRQGRNEARPDPKADLRTRKKTINNRPIPIKSPAKSFGWKVLRMVIASVGLSVIAGTAISFWQNQQAVRAKAIATEITSKEESNKVGQDIVPLELKNEATVLLGKIKELAAKEKDLAMQMMLVDLDSGAYVQIGSSKAIAAASTIKTPILVAFFQDVDAGKIKLDEQLEMTADVKVGQAGDLQYLPTGTKISALETATKMIVISDNTATNMIIKRLGGVSTLNQRFKSWGLSTTVLNNQLPDLEGTNTISTQDLVTLLAMLDRGKLIDPRSRDRFMDIMRRPVTNTLLPQGIPEEARIVHKTGDIASSVGDAGIVDMPNGKRYAIAVLVKRPDNDQRANELIRQISRLTYDYFRSGSSLPASNNSSPATTNYPDSINPVNSPNPSNSGTSVIENIPLPLPNASPNPSPSTSPNALPNAPSVTRQNP